jgi:hypothetical protein
MGVVFCPMTIQTLEAWSGRWLRRCRKVPLGKRQLQVLHVGRDFRRIPNGDLVSDASLSEAALPRLTGVRSECRLVAGCGDAAKCRSASGTYLFCGISARIEPPQVERTIP